MILDAEATREKSIHDCAPAPDKTSARDSADEATKKKWNYSVCVSSYMWDALLVLDHFASF